MKKNLFLLAAMALLIGMSSCGSKSSFEKDVRKMAEYRCKEKQMMAMDQSDPKVQKDMADLEKEIDAYGDKMKTKYKGKEDDKDMNDKADKIMDEVMQKCK